MPIATRAFAATSSTAPLSPFNFDRRDPGPEVMSVLGTRSFLLDVHLLGRGE